MIQPLTPDVTSIGALIVPVSSTSLGYAAMTYGSDEPEAIAAPVNFGVLNPKFWAEFGLQVSPAFFVQAWKDWRTGVSAFHLGQMAVNGTVAPVILWVTSGAQPDQPEGLFHYTRGPKGVIASVAPEARKSLLALLNKFGAASGDEPRKDIVFWIPSNPDKMKDFQLSMSQVLPTFVGSAFTLGLPLTAEPSPRHVRAVATDRFTARRKLAGAMTSGPGAVLRALDGDLKRERSKKEKAGVLTYLPWAPPTLAQLAARGHVLSPRAAELDRELTVAKALSFDPKAGRWIGDLVNQKTRVDTATRKEHLPWISIVSIGVTLYAQTDKDFAPVAQRIYPKQALDQLIVGYLEEKAETAGYGGLLEDEVQAYLKGLQSAAASPLAAFVGGVLEDFGISRLPSVSSLGIVVMVDPRKAAAASAEVKAILGRALSSGPNKVVLAYSLQPDRIAGLLETKGWPGPNSMAATSLNLMTDSSVTQHVLMNHVLGLRPGATGLLPFSPPYNLWSEALVSRLPAFQKSGLEYQKFVEYRVCPRQMRSSPIAQSGRMATRLMPDVPQGQLKRTEMGTKPAPGTIGVSEGMRFSDFYKIPMEIIKLLRAAGDTKLQTSQESKIQPQIYELLSRFGIQHPSEMADLSDPEARAELLDALEELQVALRQGQIVRESEPGRLVDEIPEEEDWRERLLRANPGAPHDARINPRAPRPPRGHRLVEAASRYAQANPLQPSGVQTALDWLKSGGKTDTQQVEDTFKQLREASPPERWEFLPMTRAADGSMTPTGEYPVEALFPRKGRSPDGKTKPLPADAYKPSARLPVLERADLVASPLPAPLDRQKEEAISVLGRGKNADPSAWRTDGLPYILQQAQLSLVDTKRVLDQQYHGRRNSLPMQSSTALLKTFKVRRLKEYSPQPAFFTAGGANKIVIVISPPGDFPGRVMTFRGGVHLDLDVAPTDPQQLGLGRLVGQALTSALLWIAERPKRRFGTPIYITRIGSGALTLALAPGDPLSLEAIAKQLAEAKETGQRWNGALDLESYTRARAHASSAGRKPRKHRQDSYAGASEPEPVSSPVGSVRAEAPSAGPEGTVEVEPQDLDDFEFQPNPAPPKRKSIWDWLK